MSQAAVIKQVCVRVCVRENFSWKKGTPHFFNRLVAVLARADVDIAGCFCPQAESYILFWLQRPRTKFRSELTAKPETCSRLLARSVQGRAPKVQQWLYTNWDLKSHRIRRRISGGGCSSVTVC